MMSTKKHPKNHVLVIDNYDSFVYNLVHYLRELDCEVTIWRNDRFDLEQVAPFQKILLSPGPGIPDEAGLLKEVIKVYGSEKSILGVCLGQQAIGEVYGGALVNLDKVYHGIATEINVIDKNEPLFKSLPETLTVGRYHSWVVAQPLPGLLNVTALDHKGQIMSLRHKNYDVCGVQFHPESILTPHGKKMIENWVKS